MAKLTSILTILLIATIPQMSLAFLSAAQQVQKARCDQKQVSFYIDENGNVVCAGEMSPQSMTESPPPTVAPTAVSSPTPANTISSGQLEMAVSSCKEATVQATMNCDISQNSNVRQAMAMGNQLKNQINMGAASSIAALCSQMGTFASTMNGAVAAYSAYCSAGYASCSSACDASLQEVDQIARMLALPGGYASGVTEAQVGLASKEIKEARVKCASLSENIRTATENVGSYLTLEQFKSQQCGNAVGGLDQACLKNPNTPECKAKMAQNCSNPTFAANNTVCICMSNPSDPRCGSASGNNNFAAGMNGRGRSGAGGSGASADGKIGGPFGTELDGSGFPGSIGSGGDPNLSQDGGPSGGRGYGGGRANIDGGGGSGGGGSGQGGSGGGGSGINTKIIGGYGFGRGGGTGYSGGGSGAGGGGMPSYSQRGMVNGRPVDLKQFLPGGKMDPSRALAGISGPDGITGPNSDIWSKIRARYFLVAPSLLP